MLNKVLEKNKEIIDIKQLHNTKILIAKNNKLPDDITFKKVVTLMTCVIKDHNKLYPQLFLEHALCAK